MDSITKTCPDCGKSTVVMNVDAEHQPETAEDVDSLLSSFNQLCIDAGWRLVKHGFLNLGRKWVCSECQGYYK